MMKFILIPLGETVVILLIAVGLMFALRGGSAPDLMQDRWQNGGSISGGFPKSKTVPVEPQWPSHKAMLAAAPNTELVEHPFEHDEVEFSIMAPADAEIDTSSSSNITVKISPAAHLIISDGQYDIDAMHKTLGDGWTSMKPFPYKDQSVLMAEYDEAYPERFGIFANRKLAFLELQFFADNPDEDYKKRCTKEECLLMLKCLDTLKITTEIPTDPAAVLELAGCRVTKNEAGDVIKLQTDISDVHFNSTLAKLISEFPKLEYLALKHENLSPKDIEVIKKLPELKELWLSEYDEVSDPVFQSIADCKQLERMTVNIEKVSPTVLSRLGDLNKLTQLKIRWIQREHAAAMPAFSQLTALEDLDIQYVGSKWPTGSLSFLKDLTSLKKLRVEGTVDDAAVAEIAKCQSLENLELESAQITDAGLASLAQLGELKMLRIKGPYQSVVSETIPIKVTPAGVEKLAALPNLESLIFAGTDIDDSFAEAFTKLPGLKHIGVQDAKFTDAAFETFATMESLESLNIWDNDIITEEAVTKFKEAKPDIRFYK
jgi:Leucine-rich repeat (LRR) protein